MDDAIWGNDYQKEGQCPKKSDGAMAVGNLLKPMLG